MKARQTKIILVTLTCLGFLVSHSSAYAGPSEKVAVLQSCARLFGPPVDEKQTLFEVSQAFVLQVKFTGRGRLKGLAVRPKYFFNETHPEWTEPARFPTLSKSEFQDLVRKLEGVKSKGDMVKPRNKYSVVTNSTGYFTETYKRAVLKWGELADQSGIRFFSIDYLRSKS